MPAITLQTREWTSRNGQSSKVQFLQVLESSGQTADEGTSDPTEVQLPDTVAHPLQKGPHVSSTVRLRRNKRDILRSEVDSFRIQVEILDVGEELLSWS